jgi:hypothetical protein
MPNTDYTVANSPAKPMDESALISAIDDADNRSYGSNLSNLTAALSAERALNIDLYLGKNVDPAPEGQSNVIDRTVFETVQWVLPSLCRIFANGDDIVTLQPDNPNDVAQAQQESAYLNWVVTQKNDWFSLFLEWATDALLTKNAYFLVYRDKSRKVEIEKYENQTKEGISFLLQDPEVQIIQSQEKPAPDLPPEPVLGPQGEPIVDENGQPMMRPQSLYDVTIRRSESGDDVCIRTLPPERVKIDQRAFSWRVDDRCNYFEYWEEVTLTELRDQGFNIPTDIADDPELYTQEDYARDQYGERRLERYKPTDPSMRRVKARQIWIRVDYDGDGVAELLQILRVGRRLLYVEEVSRIPIASGVACPLPHRHIGVALADITSDIQRIKTAMLRQGLDNIYLSNNPQKILNPAMVNLEDALISRPGGIVRAEDINQLRYEVPPFVFPQAMEGLAYMDQVRQARTGVSSQFQGVDSAQLSNIQPGTVSQMSSMAAERVVQIARILAFAIEDLFAIVHEQVLKMGHKRQQLQLKGEWVDVDPGGWKKRNKFKICVAFSAGNKDAQLTRLMLLAQKQLEALAEKIPVVTPENYYNTLVELTKAADFSSPQEFWTDPKQIPQPPPGPPPEIQKVIIESETKKAVEAANILQKDSESQRKAAVDKYAIDSNVGLQLLKSAQDHDNDVNLQTIKSHHDAAVASIGQQFAEATGGVKSVGSHLEKVHESIEEHSNRMGELGKKVTDVFDHVNKAVQIATGKRRIRKNAKGEIEGMDILNDKGEVLVSHKALKDHTGRVIGLQ